MGKRLEIVELGEDVLRTPCRAVDDVNDPKIQSLIDGMLDSLRRARGVGLAAPQVGVSLQLFLVSPFGKQAYPHTRIEDTLVVINPEIEKISNKTVTSWEGCLSIPGIWGLVNRPKDIRVTYTNRLGERCSEEYHEFEARVFLHEFDHLNGIVFLDKMKDLSSLMTEKSYVKKMEELEDN